MTKYTINYFIEKFEKIPDNMWATDWYEDGERKCALGWCGATEKDGIPSYTEESMALANIFGVGMISKINDGYEPFLNQETPKSRILAALKSKQ